jgi:hypothetical protein
MTVRLTLLVGMLLKDFNSANVSVLLWIEHYMELRKLVISRHMHVCYTCGVTRGPYFGYLSQI